MEIIYGPESMLASFKAQYLLILTYAPRNIKKLFQVEEFIPLIMNTISLQPPAHLRQSPAFNKEVFVDFMGAQIKTLSFLAYIIRCRSRFDGCLFLPFGAN